MDVPPVMLPRWNSGSRAADALPVAGLASRVKCELPMMLPKEIKVEEEEERAGILDAWPASTRRKRKLVRFQPDWTDAGDTFSRVESAMRTSHSAKDELQRKMVVAETEMTAERTRLEFAVAEQRRLRDSSQIACEEQKGKGISLQGRDTTLFAIACEEQKGKAISLQGRDASLFAADDFPQELESMLSSLKYAEGNIKKRYQEFQAIVTSLQADVRNLVAERDELKHKGASIVADQLRLLAELDELRQNQLKLVAERDELRQKADTQNRQWTNEKAVLQSELDAARITIQAEKVEFDAKLEIALAETNNAKTKLVSVEGDRDVALLALARQTAQVLKCDTRLEIVLIEKDIALTKKDIQLLRNSLMVH